jgi:hypothetical protein
VDPLTEIAEDVTPYHYCLNNPIANIDPTGMWTETANGYTTGDPQEIAEFFQRFGGQQNPNKQDPEKKDKKKEENKDSKGKEDEEKPLTWVQKQVFDLWIITDNAINFWSDLLGGPIGEDVTTLDKLQYATIGILISNIKLPTKGQYSYKTPKGWKNTKKLPTSPNGGFIDELGNIWKKPKGSNIQGEIHWDVTLSKKGQRRYNTTESHLNINQKGEVAH